MPSPAAEHHRRVPFSPADADALIPFCLANGCPYDAALLRRLLLNMTSDPAGVLVVAERDRPVLVATVIDRAENGVGAASLEILGVGPSVPAEAFERLVVGPAIAFARAGVRHVLHAALYESCARIDAARDALRTAGFAPCYDAFTMRRRADAPAPESPAPLPAGWRWADLDGARVDAAHAALNLTFRGAAGVGVAPLPDFRKVVASGTVVWRVLLDDETIAGLVQVVAHATHGELRTVARAPVYRGRGLGPRLVTEGLRVLFESGPRAIELSVEALNEQALGLYRRFDFEVVARMPVLSLDLR